MKNRIEVRYLGLVRLLTQKPEETVCVAGNDISALLRELSKKYGPEFKKTVIDETSNSVKPTFVISVNGTAVKDLREKFKEGDILVISTITVGG